MAAALQRGQAAQLTGVSASGAGGDSAIAAWLRCPPPAGNGRPGTNLKTGTRTGGWSWRNPLITLFANVSYRNNLQLDSKAYVDICRVHGGKYDAGDVTPPS